ncbi:MAG: DNA-directed RNA polymerase subunit alpha [Candidatus Marinimicrobia bacterium]|nr:DNA-directed RNA polymerase subunit alpha [Candidatus Neomarinimicrobiota bacterium]MBL7067761.1 DNA-directed RNA polymerase subunit alpha [Candidatus Neomarinimicrobiota bacterium]
MTAQDQILTRVVKEITTDTYGQLIVQPLERGFGTTIGNALRRVLITSVPGAAISSIKVDGVLHEFATIPGVIEDVADIILNLKQIRFKLIDPKPDKVTLKFKGEGKFVAGDIGKESSQFEILNPDLHICEMNEKAEFTMELKISRGTGWVPAEQNKTSDFPIGTIFIDSIFSPITDVSYKVERLPGTSRETLEKLILEVHTDGSITAEEAVDYSAKLLIEYFSLFTSVEATPLELPREAPDEDILKIRNLLKKSVDEMELSVRSYNCLKANNIKSIADLVSKEESEMLKFKNFGRKSLNELMAKLKEMNLEFGVDVGKYISDKEE